MLRRILSRSRGAIVHSHVVEVGSLYNAIQDPELKERCSDILSAAGNFDRVVNQATQVLEDRIRRLSDGDRNTVGVALISTAFTADTSTSKLVMSEHRDEQEGLFHVLRGIMIGFRNFGGSFRCMSIGFLNNHTFIRRCAE